MDQSIVGQGGPAAEILRLLRQKGPQSVKALEAALSVSTNAVREQLQQLLAAGLISSSSVRRGPGRPAHVYALSDKAQALFPQPYDLLLKLMLEEISREDGDGAAERVLNAIGDRLAVEVAGDVQGTDLQQRLQAVSVALTERGMPISVLDLEDGPGLREWSCPYYNVARDHAAICTMERRMLERALGARVTIAERRIDGHAGCKFVVEPYQNS